MTQTLLGSSQVKAVGWDVRVFPKFESAPFEFSLDALLSLVCNAHGEMVDYRRRQIWPGGIPRQDKGAVCQIKEALFRLGVIVCDSEAE